ncbi:MAG: aspartate kinase [Muribaculaceae bacterium]|nr:aspartate kinase [Bacteroidales bacterium]MDE6040814.1 aspartate kinase [Muribaculaceae bacterium]
MKVLKFGGTSVGSADRIKHVAELIVREGRTIVVLSAMSGTTNSLVEISDYLSKGNIPGAQETLNNLEAKYASVVNELLTGRESRESAFSALGRSFFLIRSYFSEIFSEAGEKEILAQGELISTALMLAYLKERGVKAAMLPALEYMRTLESGEPDMSHISVRLKRLLELEAGADLYITQGYICLNDRGGIDNLQRGGSDYTASIIGAVLPAEEIQIWTDIDGMHNNDPRFVEGTRPVHELHFEEAAELAYFGAKILHPSCVLPAKLANVPVRLLNTMQPDAPGTLIYNMPPDGRIKAIAAKDGITAVKIKSGRRLLAYGFLHKVFETFENHRTSIDMMATSEVGVTVTVDNDSRLAAIVDELKEFATVNIDRDMVIICVVGDLNWLNVGYEAQVVNALGDIPIRMISYGGSSYNISILVRRQDKVEALNRLSRALFD